MPFCKTPIAARELGITYWRLVSLLRCGKLSPPNKDTSGDFIWTDADLSRARLILADLPTRRAEAVAATEAAHA